MWQREMDVLNISAAALTYAKKIRESSGEWVFDGVDHCRPPTLGIVGGYAGLSYKLKPNARNLVAPHWYGGLGRTHTSWRRRDPFSQQREV